MDSEPRTLSGGIPVLRIYTAAHRDSCRESRRLAQFAVEVWDIDNQLPVDDIFAIPTFWYGGRVISLGNPSEDELCERIVASELERGDASSLLLGDESPTSIPARSRTRDVARKRSIVLGLLRDRELAGDPDGTVEAVMRAGSATYRPDVVVSDALAQLTERKVSGVLVTRSDGTLLGWLRREDVETVAGKDSP